MEEGMLQNSPLYAYIPADYAGRRTSDRCFFQ